MSSLHSTGGDDLVLLPTHLGSGIASANPAESADTGTGNPHTNGYGFQGSESSGNLNIMSATSGGDAALLPPPTSSPTPTPHSSSKIALPHRMREASEVCPLDNSSNESTKANSRANSQPGSGISSRKESFSNSNSAGAGSGDNSDHHPRMNPPQLRIIKEAAIPGRGKSSKKDIASPDSSKISAYARLDFENYTFFVQTLQVVLGRKSQDDLLQTSHHAVDVHLSSKKAISRRHGKIFYNFGTQRFELSILGRNGAFVDDLFVEKGITVPLLDGSKIQIGDIPFTFVLPSIDPATEVDTSNPSDVISMRSNFFGVPEDKPKPKPIEPESEIDIENEGDAQKTIEGQAAAERKPSKPMVVPEIKIDLEVEKVISETSTTNSDTTPDKTAAKSVKDTTTHPKEAETTKEKQASEREKKEFIQRRMSLSRRKSLASASMDEINEILKELGPEIDVVEDEDEDSEFLDAQIQSILDEYKRRQSTVVQNVEADDDLAEFRKSVNIKEEEDEIDKLVKEHNMSQGVNLDESVFMDGEADDDLKPIEANAVQHETDIDAIAEHELSELSGIDQEIASLAPLIDAHHQDLLRGKNGKSSISGPSAGSAPFSIHQPPSRSSPLMGKPAVPRMGRPASIQPPSSRLYGRPAGKGLADTSGLPPNTKAQLVNNRLTTATSPMAGLPTHLVAQGAMNSGLPLKVAQGNIMTTGPPLYKPIPPKLPQPVLEVPLVYIDEFAPKKEDEEVTINSNFGSEVSAITTPLLLTNVKVIKVCHQKELPDLSIPSKYPRKRKDLPPPHIRKPTNNKKVYTLEEVPEQYRIKPTLSYSLMISNVLKTKGSPQGLTASDVAECIKVAYPFYKYCADGWQYSINHNLALNNIFKKVGETTENEWTWGLDETYINERERVRMKQQEIAASKAKAAALKAEELKQKQILEAQQAAAQNMVAGRPGFSPYSSLSRLPQSQFMSQLHQQGGVQYPVGSSIAGGKPKTIAELASEIRRDGVVGSKAPLYFKTTSVTPNLSLAPAGPDSSIKAQLAANRASTSPPVAADGAPSINNDTKKSLAYLQKELFTLYKARKLSYNTATTTEIITKALATTIAQVNVIGAKAGCGTNALTFLVEKAPQQVSKILDIALSKSIKEKQGILSSRPPSRSSTPTPAVGSPKKTGPSQLTQVSAAAATTNTTGTGPSGSSQPQAALRAPVPTVPSTAPVPLKTAAPVPTVTASRPLTHGNVPPRPAPKYGGPSLGRPPLFNSKPGAFRLESASRTPTFSSSPGAPNSGPVLTNPPKFFSNKPNMPAYGSIPKPSYSGPTKTESTTASVSSDAASSGSAATDTIPAKRELEDKEEAENGGSEKKAIRIE